MFKQMQSRGKDVDGITYISLNNLKKMKSMGLKLKLILILKNGISCFIFNDNSYYIASGFAVGYGGEGPHGLYNAIKLWYPEIYTDFYESGIMQLTQFENYIWIPKLGVFKKGI